MILSKQKNRLFSLFQALFVRPSRNRRKFFVLGALVVFLFLLVPRPAHAGMLGELVIATLWAIVYVCKMFVSLAAELLAYMLRGDIYYFTNEPVILIGWKICRDVCNLFFLLILIFIAFCTILQIEKYHAKKTLLTLIIMALLINFSKPIAIFIFDGSQLLMNYFLNATGDYTSTVTNLSRIAEIIYNDLPSDWDRWKGWFIYTGWGVADKTMVAKQVTAIIFLFMYAVALFVMAIYLFIRLVALWVLIILSPFAFLFSAIPDFKKYADEWWSALFKYCYVGPILAFFLYLSTQLANSTFIKTADSKNTTQIGVGDVTGGLISLGNAVHFIVVLVFLYASIIMAQKLGIAFASGITSRANKVLGAIPRSIGKGAWSGTKYATKGLAKYGERKLLMPHGLSPRANWRGWKEGAEEADREALEPATSDARDKFNKLLGRKKPEGYHKNVQFEADVDKYMKEQKNISTEDKALIAVLQKFKGDKSPEAQKRVAAALRLMFENNDQNEFMKQFALVDLDFAKLGLKSNNPDDLREALTHVLGNGVAPSKMSADQQNQVGRQLHQLGNIALSKGNLGHYGMASFDEKAEKYVINDGSEYTDKNGETKKREQIPFARAKAQNIDVQEKMKRMHWNSILEEDVDGNPGNIHKTGMALLSDMKQSEISQLNRARPDFVKNLYAKRDEILKFAKSGVDPRTNMGMSKEQQNNLEHFVKGLETQYKGAEKGKGRQAGKKTGNKWGREPRARSK